MFEKEILPVTLCVPQIPLGTNWDRTRVCEVDNRRLPAHHKVFLSDTAINHICPRAHIHSSTELAREPISLLTKKGVRKAGGGAY